jgi:hypothetical protein
MGPKGNSKDSKKHMTNHKETRNRKFYSIEHWEELKEYLDSLSKNFSCDDVIFLPKNNYIPSNPDPKILEENIENYLGQEFFNTPSGFVADERYYGNLYRDFRAEFIKKNRILQIRWATGFIKRII